ncbi:hypothetical protein NMY22_g12607 [Coprinellus aureogranulatus]|nr:hypothetical protein NMY22_g12607 [Coprinellus aureogranulatus]
MSPSNSATPMMSQTTASALPDLQTLTSDQVAYLREEWASKWITMRADLDSRGTGVRRVGGVKGAKKTWSNERVYPKFVEKFYPPGTTERPNAESVKDKIYRWFLNIRNEGDGRTQASSDETPIVQADESRKSASPIVPPTRAPRPTTAAALFAKEESEQVKTKMNDLRVQEGATVQKANFKNYRAAKNQLFDALPDEKKAEYEERAVLYNASLKTKPPLSHIYENQATIDVRTMETLHELVGDDWGQVGRAAFFTMGAFRDADDRLKLFNVSVGPGAMTPFTESMIDYKTSLRAPFKKWAEGVLPVKGEQPSAASEDDSKRSEVAESVNDQRQEYVSHCPGACH